jgi:hypothetical protein
MDKALDHALSGICRRSTTACGRGGMGAGTSARRVRGAAGGTLMAPESDSVDCSLRVTPSRMTSVHTPMMLSAWCV